MLKRNNQTGDCSSKSHLSCKLANRVNFVLQAVCPGLTHGQKIGISYLNPTYTQDDNSDHKDRDRGEHSVEERQSIVISGDQDDGKEESDDSKYSDDIRESGDNGSQSVKDPAFQSHSAVIVSNNDDGNRLTDDSNYNHDDSESDDKRSESQFPQR